MLISPRFTVEDWNFGKCSDIDVAEDQISGWIFDPARTLISRPDSGVAVLQLVTPYFELAQSYHTGLSSLGKENEFLQGGLALVFPDSTPAAREAYVHHVRHGLLKGGIFRRALLHPGNPLFPDFGLLPDGKTLALNPAFVLESAQKHSRKYFAALREGTDYRLLDNFIGAFSIRKKA